MDEPELPLAQRSGFGKLRELVNGNPSDGVGWDNAWKQDVTPWNAGKFQPPLKELITSQMVDLPRNGRALVPGCGRGYESVLIASLLGLKTLGIDISPTAVQVANDIHANSLVGSPGQVEFKVVDFFKYTVSNEDRYDIIFDYLFFPAIGRTMRKDWGRRMKALTRPGGYLIALVFPIDPETDLGPPFAIRPEQYTESLGEGWTKVLDMVPKSSLASHVGREKVLVWKRNA